jgi:hypothetical protein
MFFGNTHARIEEHPNFKGIIEDDPFALLEAINTLIHDPLTAQCSMVSATNAMARALNLRQGPT